MSYEFSSGIRLQVGHIIQDPVGSYEYVVEEVLESGANAFAAKADRRKKGSVGVETIGKVFLKKYKSPGGASSWFDGFVDYQQEIRKRLQDHPTTRNGMVDILRFFQRSLGGDSRRRAYYQLFAWEGQANNLRHYLKNGSRFAGQKESAERFQLACDFLAGLAAIHHTGVIHSDLKPENLMLNPDSQGILKLKFVDFDFSLLKNKEAPWINPQKPEDKMGYLGTERYLSPEHLQGHRPSEASDIFTAGIIVSELLAGLHPVGQDKEMYNRRVLGGQFGKVRLPDPIRSVVDDPDELDRSINRMLSFEKNHRPSASELADLFETKRKYSIVPAESGESSAAKEHAKSTFKAANENNSLVKGSSETVAESSRSKPPLIVSEPPAHRPDVFEGRAIEERRGVRKIVLFIGLLVGIPFFIWKTLVPSPQSQPISPSRQAPSVASNNKPPQSHRAGIPENDKKVSGFIPTPAQRLPTTPAQPPILDQPPQKNVMIRAKQNVRFNFNGYIIEGDTIRRLNLNVNHKANSQDIFSGMTWPILGQSLTEFRIWSPLLERIVVRWGGTEYDPLAHLGETDHDGFYGSMANGEVGLNPRIHDMEIFNPDNRNVDIVCSYNGNPLLHYVDYESFPDRQRFFGEIIQLKYNQTDASAIKVRFDNDGEDEGKVFDLGTLAEHIRNDSQNGFYFVELLPQ